MGTVIIREYVDIAYGKPGAAGGGDLIRGELATDINGTAIKSVATTPGSSVDSPKLSARTHFVALESSVNQRYALRPKRNRWVSLPATVNHNPLPAGGVVYEAVYPGAVLSFYEVGTPTSVPSIFRPGYVPILGL